MKNNSFEQENTSYLWNVFLIGNGFLLRNVSLDRNSPWPVKYPCLIHVYGFYDQTWGGENLKKTLPRTKQKWDTFPKKYSPGELFTVYIGKKSFRKSFFFLLENYRKEKLYTTIVTT